MPPNIFALTRYWSEGSHKTLTQSLLPPILSSCNGTDCVNGDHEEIKEEEKESDVERHDWWLNRFDGRSFWAAYLIRPTCVKCSVSRPLV